MDTFSNDYVNLKHEEIGFYNMVYKKHIQYFISYINDLGRIERKQLL